MEELLRKLGTQFYDFFKELSITKKIAAIVAFGGVFFGLAATFKWASESQYYPLMTNLSQEDSTSIIRVLRDKKIPFQVADGGKTVEVPNDSVFDLRLELATLGFPNSSVVGYEVFDKQSLGTTSFVQKINQKRALEGEIMRTVQNLQGVQRVRVHLALPQKSAFVEDQKKPSASVLLDLAPGIRLTEQQITGVVNLVSKAVEGMDSRDVVVVDAGGKVLTKNSDDTVSSLATSQLEYKTKIERQYENRVSEILSRIVGEGKVVAKVTADIDFTQVNEVETTYDQDGSAIASRDSNTQAAQARRPGPGGLPGAQSNLTNQEAPPETGTKTDTNKNREIVNYNVPQTVRKKLLPTGTVSKLSVSVVVDGKRTKVEEAEGEEGRTLAQTKVEPWSEEKLKEFEGVITSALGIDKKRGDVLSIKNFEFVEEDFTAAQNFLAEQEKQNYIRNLLKYLLIGGAILLFFLFAVRPFIKWLTENTTENVDSFLPQTVEELERLQKSGALTNIETALPQIPESVDPDKIEGDMIKEKIVTLVETNPSKAALIMKEWLVAEANNKKNADQAQSAGS